MFESLPQHYNLRIQQNRTDSPCLCGVFSPDEKTDTIKVITGILTLLKIGTLDPFRKEEHCNHLRDGKRRL